MRHACALAILFAAAGCATPAAPRARPQEPELPPAESPASAPRVPRAPPRTQGTIAVRLGAWQGAPRVTILGALGGEVVLAREGKLVRDAHGATQAEVIVRAAPRSAGLKLGERTYRGSLRVRPLAAGGLEVTNLVDLEDYVEGVVGAELSVWSALPSELEAQAIASRSYAVAALEQRGLSREEPYLFDDARDQAYAGIDRVRPDGLAVASSAKKRAAESEAPVPASVAARVADAVRRTRARVLVEQGRVVDARFHAACGGRTAEGKVIFPEADFACLRAVDCEPCRADESSAWRFTASRATLDGLAGALGIGPRLERVAPSSSDDAGRWLELELTGSSGARKISFEDLRKRFGHGELASALVERTWPRAGEPITNGLMFEGRGRGHGVGLCQTGARGYAQRGWNAERILAHYYPGAQILAPGAASERSSAPDLERAPPKPSASSGR